MIAAKVLKPFMLPDSDEEIGSIVEVKSRAIQNLGRYGVGEGCELIESAMKASYTPTAQIIRIIREVVGRARAHVAKTYSSEDDFRARCNKDDLVPKEPGFATALVGLGGTGKTQLFRAIERLLTRDESTIDVAGLPRYPLEPIWIMTMIGGKSLSALLEPFVGAGATGASILKPAAKRAYTNGVGMAVLDESQFITATQAGHAKAAEVVMKSTYIGPPLFYGANFTMINKLEKRPQQERDRLLSNVLVLNPERHGSDDYGRILASQLEVFSEYVASDHAISVKAHAEHIHNYVFGINRKSAILLNLAWRFVREEAAMILTISHVERAYKSEMFASHREEVELLRRQVFENKKARDDLWCSFAPPIFSNVVVASSLIEEKERRIAEALSRSTMTKAERDAYDAVITTTGSVGKQKACVVGFPKADKSLEALQAAGTELMAEFE